MKQVAGILSFFCFIAIQILDPCLLQAGTIVVSGPADHAIYKAISRARSGDTVLIYQGIYHEGNLVINRKLFIRGSGNPVLDGSGQSGIFNITADSVVIDGLTLQNTGFSYIHDRAGILVDQADHCKILNNNLDFTCFGIYLKTAKHCQVVGNRITGKPLNEVNSGNGIHLYDCNDIELRHNIISGHRDGIYLEFVGNSRITGNLSRVNLRYGLHFMFSNHDDYIGNTFEHNGTGVAVMFSKFIIMRENRFLDNWGSAAYGLLFKEILDGELTGNVFRRNSVGLLADGMVRMKIRYNEFSENGWAINILGNSTNNMISNNNFLSNTFDVTTNSNQANNVFLHNYWDQYTGYDLDRNGLGDVPYKPVKLFSYLIDKVSASIILLRSFFADVINFAEKVSPVITPVNLMDREPSIKKNIYAGNQGA
jgi:nitrous oxidase accessory protein